MFAFKFQNQNLGIKDFFALLNGDKLSISETQPEIKSQTIGNIPVKNKIIELIIAGIHSQGDAPSPLKTLAKDVTRVNPDLFLKTLLNKIEALPAHEKIELNSIFISYIQQKLTKIDFTQFTTGATISLSNNTFKIGEQKILLVAPPSTKLTSAQEQKETEAIAKFGYTPGKQFYFRNVTAHAPASEWRPISAISLFETLKSQFSFHLPPNSVMLVENILRPVFVRIAMQLHFLEHKPDQDYVAFEHMDINELREFIDKKEKSLIKNISSDDLLKLQNLMQDQLKTLQQHGIDKSKTRAGMQDIHSLGPDQMIDFINSIYIDIIHSHQFSKIAAEELSPSQYKALMDTNSDEPIDTLELESRMLPFIDKLFQAGFFSEYNDFKQDNVVMTLGEHQLELVKTRPPNLGSVIDFCAKKIQAPLDQVAVTEKYKIIDFLADGLDALKTVNDIRFLIPNQVKRSPGEAFSEEKVNAAYPDPDGNFDSPYANQLLERFRLISEYVQRSPAEDKLNEQIAQTIFKIAEKRQAHSSIIKNLIDLIIAGKLPPASVMSPKSIPPMLPTLQVYFNDCKALHDILMSGLAHGEKHADKNLVDAIKHFFDTTDAPSTQLFQLDNKNFLKKKEQMGIAITTLYQNLETSSAELPSHWTPDKTSPIHVGAATAHASETISTFKQSFKEKLAEWYKSVFNKEIFAKMDITPTLKK